MKKIKVAYKGRICKYPQCKIILSIYNTGCFCHVHHYKMVSEGKLKSARF